MAEYFPVLARAVAALEQNTGENRRAVYERARAALVRQLRGYDPPLSESEITRERLALEDAIRRVEADARAQQAAAGAPAPAAPAPRQPAPAGPAPRAPVSPGLATVHAAAADAANLGQAAASAQVTARHALDGNNRPPAQMPPPRVEPRFTPGAPPPANDLPPYEDDEPAAGRAAVAPPARKSRVPAVVGVIVVMLLGALGAGAYVARDQLREVLGGGDRAARTAANQTTSGSSSGQPKISDRIGGETRPGATAPAGNTSGSPAMTPRSQPSEPTTAAAPTPAQPANPPAQNPAQAPSQTQPGTAPTSVPAVAQRAILYEESPDQQGGAAHPGTVIWRVEPVPGSNPAAQETQLRADVTIPDRDVRVALVFRRNTDATLPASHTIDIQFRLPPDFNNAGVANVPGILFKPSEDAGGSALTALSVRVTNGIFLIGLSNVPAERTQNLSVMRERSWIDLPVLYENGRRAVLTLEKGTPGERAFSQAFTAWENSATQSQAQGQPAPQATTPPAQPQQ